MRTPSVRGWPIWASLGVHGALLAATAALVGGRPAHLPELAAVELVDLESPAAPLPPQLRKVRGPLRPPRAAPRDPAETSPPGVRLGPAPDALSPASALLSSAPYSADGSSFATPPDGGQRFLAAAAGWPSAPFPAGAPRGSGSLLTVGDLPGGPSESHAGALGAGDGAGDRGATAAASSVAVAGGPEGLTSFARPAGGYQVRPRYPESARRQGIEGEALLRFQVLATGRVASVSVVRSAGHPDLDRAAVEAVQAWRFEPARRGKEPVAVWVTLPVRFRLQGGGDE